MDAESALVEILPAGAYTAILAGAGGTTGVGLVEVYRLPWVNFPGPFRHALRIRR